MVRATVLAALMATTVSAMVLSRPIDSGNFDGDGTSSVGGNVVRLDVYMEAQCPDTSRGNVVRLDVYMEAKCPDTSRVTVFWRYGYMDAQCPDSSRFIRAQLMPAWKKLSATGRVDWNLIPFGKARCIERPDGDFDCTCQHGANECVLNQLMNCVIETIQHPDRFMEVVECIQGKPNLDAALEKCIATSESLSVDQMQQCASSSHGRKLLALAGAKTASLSPRLTFVPWIMLNGERVVDALYDLPGNLCKLLEPAPVACS
ncbi:hypothetical protein PRIPAC_87411 [Pristionchus pacificus]|uniref:Uncharacterized protein n=1 Tax=Pristionchus pacificus TaxID=54126 RepID=A0A2A6B6B7_PRIPA|nr:hypothetical protein PRIPAC_87411 [Pristionchus pacificus]|eukprot:PDM61414.1 hypothetical protein PRIPAC_50856 [Pristionchus pacificus]